MPWTITGWVRVAEKMSPTLLSSEESRSLMRTVKIVPGFAVNGGETIGESCANTMPATNSKVTTKVFEIGVRFIPLCFLTDTRSKVNIILRLTQATLLEPPVRAYGAHIADYHRYHHVRRFIAKLL